MDDIYRNSTCLFLSEKRFQTNCHTSRCFSLLLHNVHNHGLLQLCKKYNFCFIVYYFNIIVTIFCRKRFLPFSVSYSDVERARDIKHVLKISIFAFTHEDFIQSFHPIRLLQSQSEKHCSNNLSLQ